jgi:hypothetical protein
MTLASRPSTHSRDHGNGDTSTAPPGASSRHNPDLQSPHRVPALAGGASSTACGAGTAAPTPWRCLDHSVRVAASPTRRVFRRCSVRQRGDSARHRSDRRRGVVAAPAACPARRARGRGDRRRGAARMLLWALARISVRRCGSSPKRRATRWRICGSGLPPRSTPNLSRDDYQAAVPHDGGPSPRVSLPRAVPRRASPGDGSVHA